jgi:hypothetical protein
VSIYQKVNYFKDINTFNDNVYLKHIDYRNAIPQLSQRYQNQPITINEQRSIDESSKKQTQGELNMDLVKQKLDEVQGNAQKIWKRIFPKPYEEIIFYSTPKSGFYMLIYIFDSVLRNKNRPPPVTITVQYIKQILLGIYTKYFETPGYKEKVIDILKHQGKSKLFKSNAPFEQVLQSESYYVTDLDIWVLAKALALPIVLFSATSLKSLFVEKIDWLLMGGNPHTDIYYFVRSPTKLDVMEYQLVLPGTKLTETNMTEFYTIVRSEGLRSTEEGTSLHLQQIDTYLEKYKKTVSIIRPKKKL